MLLNFLVNFVVDVSYVQEEGLNESVDFLDLYPLGLGVFGHACEFAMDLVRLSLHARELFRHLIDRLLGLLDLSHHLWQLFIDLVAQIPDHFVNVLEQLFESVLIDLDQVV